jgi:hypothetical protein
MVTTPEQTQKAVTPDARRQPREWLLALAVQVTVVALAFGLAEPRLGITLTLPGAPWNWVIVAVPIVLAIAAGAVWRRAAWMRWLSGAQFAVVSLSLASAIALAGTLILQGEPVREATEAARPDVLLQLGLRAMYTSPPFVAAILLVLLNLATVTGRRLVTPRRGNLGFVLNHVGLMLLIYAMMAGAPLFRKPLLMLLPGHPTSEAQDEQDRAYDIGAKVTLNRFQIEYFPPHLAGIDFAGGMKKHTFDLDSGWATKGHVFRVYGSSVEVLDYLPQAMPTDDTYETWKASTDEGVQAVQVRITNGAGTTTRWLAVVPMFFQPLDDLHFIGLAEALPKSTQTPKAYRSYLTITEPGRAPYARTLEVNRPVRVGAWTLYQSSYQSTEAGYASVVQAVNDPALPLVYTAFVCIVLGAFVSLWITPPRRKEQTPVDDAVAAPAEEATPVEEEARHDTA